MSQVSIFAKGSVFDFYGQPSAPANPPAGQARMFYNVTSDTFHVIDSAGVELLGGGSSAFSSITGGTNTTAALVIGTGASLSFSGTGIVNANELTGVVVSGVPSIGQVLTATSTTAANWQAPAGGSASSLTLAVTSITTAAYAVDPHTAATYIINTAGVNSMTIAVPTVTTDDGKVIKIVSGMSASHTLTCASTSLRCGTAAITTVNFSAYYGSSIELMAYQGLWYVMAQNLIASYA